MADDDQSQEKTEEPSGKRLQQAKEKGQVARSKDLSAAVILVFTALGFLIFGKEFVDDLAIMMRQSFSFDTETLITSAITFERLFFLAHYGVTAVIPILIVIFFLSISTPLLMGGWVFSTDSIKPKLSRLSLIKGLARMISVKGLMEMFKSFLKFILVAAVSLVVLKAQIPTLLALGASSVETAMADGGYLLIKSFALISASLIVIVLIDVPFQLYTHHKSMKMTKQEVKDEHKDSDGKPEVKSALRRAQHELARRRMMAEIPKADVVLTNPTHYAVAISYKKSNNKAPVVVAKGKDLIAFQISNEAKNHRVPIICVPPLARSLYFSTKLNREIPRGLYVAVAQVLAYVFQLHDKQRYDYKPDILQNVPIPPDLARTAEDDTE